ncbi:hypothetical protein [uncultured Prevotella sp.]|uniref:hypothetical protein n=1 Tax=uncultured Prevotella sp. TaxID=159272 RepID=UPI00258E55FA|nr:hypothetical protein [uncultured Prevotella sp.]
MKQRMTIYDTLLWAVLLLMVWGVSSCSDDSEPMDGDTLELLSYSREMEEVTRTATVPAGYQLYVTQHPEVVEEGHAICAYLTVAPQEASLRRFVYETDHWHSNAIVKNGVDYYIYGYLPMGAVDNTAISPLQDNYSLGATLHMEGLDYFSNKDISLIVGVKGTENADDDVEVKLGNFLYQGKGRNQNHVHLLFDHLYSALRFSIRVDQNYAEMRKIHVKSIVLTTDAKAKVNADIVMKPGATPINSITYTSVGTTKGEYTLLDADHELTTAYETLGVPTYFASGASVNLKLQCVYDVYDRKNNLVRKDCTSENKLQDVLQTIKRGERRTVKLTVKPTFIYVLSDPDLDSPTVVTE